MAYQIDDLGKVAISIIVFVVIVGIGASILSTMQTAQTNSAASTYELLSWAGNNSAMGTTNCPIVPGSFTLKNNATTVNQGDNYTVSLTGCSVTITNKSGDNWGGRSEWVTSNLNFSYSYYFGSVARNATGYGLSGVNKLASFTPTIAIVVAAAIVLGAITLLFGRKIE